MYCTEEYSRKCFSTAPSSDINHHRLLLCLVSGGLLFLLLLLLLLPLPSVPRLYPTALFVHFCPHCCLMWTLLVFCEATVRPSVCNHSPYFYVVGCSPVAIQSPEKAQLTAIFKRARVLIMSVLYNKTEIQKQLMVLRSHKKHCSLLVICFMEALKKTTYHQPPRYSLSNTTPPPTAMQFITVENLHAIRLYVRTAQTWTDGETHLDTRSDITRTVGTHKRFP